MKTNKKAMIIAIIAGFCLLLSGTSGFATWKTIQQFVTNHIINNFYIFITHH